MTVHKCDFCKEIIKDYTTYILPVNTYVYAEKQGIKIAKFKNGVIHQKIDLCEKCSQVLANLYDSYLYN
jgi:hypothetical protein